jgi:integrase
LLEQFLAFKKDKLAPSYADDYARIINRTKEYWGNKDVRNIKRQHLNEFLAHLQTTYSHFSNKTLKNEIDVFRSFLRWCRDEQEINITVPALPEIRIDKPDIKYFDTKTQVEIFNHIPDEDKPFISFLVLHGCRPGEARGLKCADADLTAGIINVRGTFSGKVYRERRKGKKSKPYVMPIHPEMLEWIKTRCEGCEDGQRFLFLNPRTGTHHTEPSLQRLWDSIRTDAGLDASVRLYDFTRHSFGTNLARSNTPLYKISLLMGHADTRTTENNYLHLAVDDVRAEAHKITLKPKKPSRKNKKT